MINIIGQPYPIDFTNGGYGSIMPAYNPIVYTVESDNISECNFRYVCDIYINSFFITRLKLFPDLNARADFKVARVLQDYLVTEPSINIYGFTSNLNRIIEYQLKFGEEYDLSPDCNQTPVIYPDLTVSDVNYTWNAAMQYREWVDYINTDLTKYILDTTNYGKFLTHSPTTQLIGMGEQAELSYLALPNSNNYASELTIETFDSNNNITATASISNSDSIVTDYTTMFQTVGIGTDNINNALGYPFIDTDTFKYRVSLTAGTSAILNLNPDLDYLAGSNYWSTEAYGGCSSQLGITVANKMQLVIPDVSCASTFNVQYTAGTFIQGQTYQITFIVDTVNNPSANPQYFKVKLGGNSGIAHGGTGSFTDTIVAGAGGTLNIEGYMDADTAGFGSHSQSISYIAIKQISSTRSSEYKYYEIDRRPTRINPRRFRWLNLLGGYDSYAFTQDENITTDITRTEYNKLYGSFNESSEQFEYNVGDRGRTNTSINAKDKVLVTSNWLTEDESKWINELYTSSDIYVQDVNKIYSFYNILPLDPDNPNELPTLYINCPFTEDELNLLTLKGDLTYLTDKCTDSVNIDIEVPTTGTVTAPNLITLQTDLLNPILPDCGIVYLFQFPLKQDPIIITSNTYTTKQKYKVKNINQSIEFEYAFDKNIQRN